jgi:hypothetical protein
MGIKLNLPSSRTAHRQVSSSKRGTKIHTVSIAAKAAQVNPVGIDWLSNPGFSEGH